MKNRLLAGVLSVLLGAFGAQKFYLGRKVDGVLSLLLCWTGIPFVVGILEGVWILSRENVEWNEYLSQISKSGRTSFLVSMRWWIIPMGIWAFFLWALQHGHPFLRFSGILLIVSIWVHPSTGEAISFGRLRKFWTYRLRSAATLVAWVALLAVLAIGDARYPEVSMLSGSTTTLTGGELQVRIKAFPTTNVKIGGLDAKPESVSGTYVANIALKERVTRFHVRAENGRLSVEKDFEIFRAPNDAELAAERQRGEEIERAEVLAKKRQEDARIAEERAKRAAEEEEQKCQANEECRKRKELEAKLIADKAKSEEISVWLKNHKVEPWTWCKLSVKELLVAPATADFAGYSDTLIRPEWGYLYVRSFVDSQNRFWAMIRSKFYCQLSLEGSELKMVDMAIE